MRRCSRAPTGWKSKSRTSRPNTPPHPPPAPTAHVHFLARIGGSGDRRILGRFEADARQAATENRLTAIVDAYARAAETALSEIAVQADEALANVSAARP